MWFTPVHTMAMRPHSLTGLGRSGGPDDEPNQPFG